MKKLFWLICSLCCIFNVNAISFEQKQYLNALEDQIKFAERKAAIYLQQLQSNPKKSDDFQRAMKMIDVKKSLYKNFSDSQSLESPTVRTMLMDVMRKDNITEQDLTALQKEVNDILKR